MSRLPWSSTHRQGGFTLIEVIAALVVFSLGVLMVVQVSGALGTQMKYAAARSEIVVLAHEDLDSLEATPFDSISAGVNYTIVTVEGLQYYRVSTVTEVTPVLYQIMVSLTSLKAGAPTYTRYSYASDDW